MKRLLSAALACALIATPAVATPPPLRVAVTFMPFNLPDRDAGAQGEALRQALIANGWFAETPSSLNLAVATCLMQSDIPACLRGHTHATLGKGPPEVIVLITTEAGRARLQCIGPGETAKSPERQTAVIDLANPGAESRQAAATCIIAAAAESGW